MCKGPEVVDVLEDSRAEIRKYMMRTDRHCEMENADRHLSSGQ